MRRPAQNDSDQFADFAQHVQRIGWIGAIYFKRALDDGDLARRVAREPRESHPQRGGVTREYL